MGDKGDKSAARPPETGGLFGPESALGFEHPSGTNARRPSQKARSVPIFVAASHRTRLDARSKARRPIKEGQERADICRRLPPDTLAAKSQRAMYLFLPPTRHDLTQGQKPEGQLKWG